MMPIRHSLQASPWLWMSPLGLLLAAIFLYPMIDVIRLSFTDAGLVGSDYSYTLDSYEALFGSSGFLATVRVTIVFVAVSVVFQIVLGLSIALLVDLGVRRGLRGTVVTRTAVISAWAIPGVIIGVIWGILYQETDAGILNYLLGFLGVEKPIAFVSDASNALISIIVANVWRGTAFSMILMYAGLQTIPEHVVDAARVDGANAWQTLTKVTLPLMAPILLIATIIVTVDTFNTFDMVLALTAGGPGEATQVIALSVYDEIFNQLNLGRGAANALVLLLVNSVMTAVYIRFVERRPGVA